MQEYSTHNNDQRKYEQVSGQEKSIDNEQQSESFFDKIAFLQLSDKKKSDVADKVLGDLFADKLYYIEIVLSAVIAALGLLINSTAVVIGAMLIAPILRPIQGMAFSISTGSNNLYINSGRLLLLSVVASVGISGLIAFTVPFATPTAEILARTSPTILDLMIALASGCIAILSLGFNKLSESIAGVAMAASLIPPLCVTGIGLAWFNWDIARGSFLLFLANLIAIIIVGVVIFYAYGFFPTNKQGQRTSAQQVFLIVLTTLAVVFPLYTGLQQIARDVDISSGVRSAIISTLPSIDTRAMLESFDYELSNKTVIVNATITLPDSSRVTPDDKSVIIRNIAEEIDKPVALTLNIVPITSVYVPKTVEPTREERVEAVVQEYLDSLGEVFLLDSKVRNGDPVVVSLEVYSQEAFDAEQMQESLLSRLDGLFDETPLLVLDVQGQTEVGIDINSTGSTLLDTLSLQFESLFSGSVLTHLEASEGTTVVQVLVESGTVSSGQNLLESVTTEILSISLDFETDTSELVLNRLFSGWKTSLELQYNKLVEFDITVRRFRKLLVE